MFYPSATTILLVVVFLIQNFSFAHGVAGNDFMFGSDLYNQSKPILRNSIYYDSPQNIGTLDFKEEKTLAQEGADNAHLQISGVNNYSTNTKSNNNINTVFGMDIHNLLCPDISSIDKIKEKIFSLDKKTIHENRELLAKIMRLCNVIEIRISIASIFLHSDEDNLKEESSQLILDVAETMEFQTEGFLLPFKGHCFTDGIVRDDVEVQDDITRSHIYDNSILESLRCITGQRAESILLLHFKKRYFPYITNELIPYIAERDTPNSANALFECSNDKNEDSTVRFHALEALVGMKSSKESYSYSKLKTIFDELNEEFIAANYYDDPDFKKRVEATEKKLTEFVNN